MWKKNSDGSIEDADGKVIFFSTARFVQDIVLGECCFICGARPGQKPFNDEHVIPEWILRRYNLFDRKITLPNETGLRYGSYTVPCCADCNALMGRHFEEPISHAVNGGRLLDLVSTDPLLVYAWLALIYLKTHLKDRALRLHLDTRKGSEKIADDYDWTELHHLHCLARYFYSGAEIEREAAGSFTALNVDNGGSTDRFDYSDLYQAQTAMLSLDDVAIYAVMNDSGASLCNYFRDLEKLTGPLSHVQAREVMVHLAFINLNLKERTRFHTECDMDAERCRIVASRPEKPELASLDFAQRGRILRKALSHVLPHMTMPGFDSPEQIAEAIESGYMTFLFDDDGKFITDSWRPN
jgi:hypothetical protein